MTISLSQTTASAADFGSGNLGSATTTASGLTLTSHSGNLFIGLQSGSNSIAIVEALADNSISSGENIDVTPAEPMVVDAITISGFGGNDSPVILTGFPADPGASFPNGTAVFAGNTVTLTATTFSSITTVSFANTVVITSLNIRCNGINTTAAGVGIPSVTYRAASTPPFSTARIAGIFGDDHSEITDAPGDPDTKAIVTTEEDWIDHDPARYTGLEIRWEQAGGANGANVVVRPMVEVGGQWFASSTAFPVTTDNSPFANKTLAFTPAAAAWREVTLAENSATLGAAPATDLAGKITNLGFLADFSADNESQTVLLDRLELAGTPLFPDQEPWTFVSSPDFTNSDIADLSGALYGALYGGPPSSGWDGGVNGTAAELEDSFLSFFQALSSESPDLFLVAGDLVEGEWFKDASNHLPIGPVNSDANRELAFVEGSFYYYGHYQNHWFIPNDLRVIACVGDHELGDNDWAVDGQNTKLIPTMRNEFSRWFTRFPIGQWSTYLPNGRPDRSSPDFPNTPAPLIYPDRPVGSPHEQTAFAIRHKDTLIISMDVFQHVNATTVLYPFGGTVKPELEATQLAWVQNLLAEAEADPSIRHIVTPCHTPILQPVINTASSGMTYANGESSPLFQAMAAHGVDLHFSGEVHDIAASRHMGVQQIVHGSPPGSRVLNYLVARVPPDRLDCTIKTGRQFRDNSVPKYAPTNATASGAGFAEMRVPFKPAGHILIDKSGPTKVISEGTGLIANIEHDDDLLHYSFDHAPGTRSMPNGATLPDVNADGQKKWRGDLDTAWQATSDFIPGKFGNALRFAGECPTPINKPRTMAFWMRTDRTGFQNIAGTAYSAATANPSIQILTRTTSFTGHLRLGRHVINTNAPYNGELDDFVIWGRALSPAEISLLHAFANSSLNDGVAQADPLLKAFRRGEGVEIDGTTWFFVGTNLRGKPGTAYDLDGDALTPFAEGTGMTTQPDPFQRSLRAGLPAVDIIGKQITLTWNSLPGASYVVNGSDDFISWAPRTGRRGRGLAGHHHHPCPHLRLAARPPLLSDCGNSLIDRGSNLSAGFL